MRPTAEQTILITGATDGLGRALAIDLAGTGATLRLRKVSDQLCGLATASGGSAQHNA